MLDDLRTPADLRTLDIDQPERLAHQIREFLVGSVCRTGGHLGSNVGVVELTLALHRVFEQAVTSAAGPAVGGFHPVVSLYATFANRAFDQVLLDVGLHGLPVTFVLDRAGITGPDGPSHHGVWDIAMLGIVPGMRVAAPRDPATLLEELDEAVATESGPTALRFPKATAGPELAAVERWQGVDVLRRSRGQEVLLVVAGPLAGAALEAAGLLAAEGTECTVVDPRWLLPANPVLTTLACSHQVVVTVEDGVRDGGFGRRLAAEVAEAGARPRMRTLGVPSSYVVHGARSDLLARFGLDAEGVAAAVRDLRPPVPAGEPEALPATRADSSVRAFAGTLR
ncbi:transketolase C-terminal domain-containing protein [Actinopolymorpha singaporensis]|uniref:1-deoxy-D-xylulose-5-phosphate synthase n=1 Tax=Actinopolymorpha singaporensis TaxID=117157 RepID=A0A1H1TKL2_9ACTN|nr:transketolase C-terminal domain-containing protein [Actinopolymorpha singaporensis]SDS60069.1 1-deoxy-D-xylulose-5-phosphate synthase [Actinopolymorpha singaporensis]